LEGGGGGSGPLGEADMPLLDIDELPQEGHPIGALRIDIPPFSEPWGFGKSARTVLPFFAGLL
jgi:hypothetical protein